MQREASPEPSRRLQKDGIDSDLKRQAGAGRQHTGPRENRQQYTRGATADRQVAVRRCSVLGFSVMSSEASDREAEA